MTGISNLGQSTNMIRLIGQQQRQLNDLSIQLTTKKKTQVFSGLGDDALRIQRSRSQISNVDQYLSNITNANTRVELTLNAIEEFQKHANNLLDFMNNLSKESAHQEGEVVYFDDPSTPDVVENIAIGYDSAEPDIDFKSMQQFASNIIDTFRDLINIQDGDRYLLTGSSTLTEPLSSTNGLSASIGTLIDGWKNGTITTDEIISDLNERTATTANPNAITDSVVGYSSPLSAGTTKSVFIRVNETTEIDYTTLANADAFRDIMVAVAYVGNENLPPIADHVDPDSLAVIEQGAPGADNDESRGNFFEVLQSLATAVAKATDEIDLMRFDLENARIQMKAAEDDLKSQRKLLVDFVADTENIDETEVALSVNILSVQLDASFRLTAKMQELSLVNFI